MSGMTRIRVKVDKTCKHCGTHFTVPNYRKDTAEYCGRKCMALAARMQIIANCEICGTEFTHIASRANKAKYCSRKCYHKAQINRGTQKYTCEHCGTDFLDSPSHKRKYCSKKCVNKAHKLIWAPKPTTVRKIMARRNLIVHCERCGYDAEPKILGVHHKDRNRNNNTPENLEMLCPNCHSLEHAKHIAHGFKE